MAYSTPTTRTSASAATLAAAAVLLAAMAVAPVAGLPSSGPEECRAMLGDSPRRVRVVAAVLLAAVRDLSVAHCAVCCVDVIGSDLVVPRPVHTTAPQTRDLPSPGDLLGEGLLNLPPPLA